VGAGSLPSRDVKGSPTVSECQRRSKTDVAISVATELAEHDLVEENEIDYSDGSEEDNLEPSLIRNPGRATRLERKWLEAMMEGKSEGACYKFERLYMYFDGKKTTDEILFRTDMSRRQLREVLHEFDKYLLVIVSLHP